MRGAACNTTQCTQTRVTHTGPSTAASACHTAAASSFVDPSLPIQACCSSATVHLATSLRSSWQSCPTLQSCEWECSVCRQQGLDGRGACYGRLQCCDAGPNCWPNTRACIPSSPVTAGAHASWSVRPLGAGQSCVPKQRQRRRARRPSWSASEWCACITADWMAAGWCGGAAAGIHSKRGCAVN